MTSAAASATRAPVRDLPTIHPRPRAGWINDPNGIIRHEGRYHVFFQHNPGSARHGDIVWGHMSSADLLAWEQHPPALRPQPGEADAAGCWSGVAVLDDAGRPTAVYTGVTADGGASSVIVATGRPGLAGFEQPGRLATGMPPGEPFTDVRDPFVFHHGGRRYAIQGAGSPGGDPAILLYDATVLDDWVYLGTLLDSTDPLAARLAPANIWECPQLLEIDGTWVLILSLWRNDGGEHRLSGVSYLHGALEAVPGQEPAGLSRAAVGAGPEVAGPAAPALRLVPAGGGEVDSGPDFYAPQVLREDGRALLWGWSWEGRPQEESDAAGWAGMLTLPRELGFSGGRLVSVPAAENAGFRRGPLDWRAGGTVLPDAAEVHLDAADGDAELVLEGPEGTVTVARLPIGDGLRIVVDVSIAEVFRTGSVPHTVRAYPGAGQAWAVRVPAGATGRAWELAVPSAD
ncbi:glycoside hydrolase family 32 protein [Zafaria sp. Z1313]|uniref:glycoside hydrolase family 32 protein n=1 Tax=unclassified Zafaria TaxID=2828765 RepID=UPI002E75AFF7|nr:glycoside hydrolase family 32 protein [Zafaria sp. J156]MEE1620081.1 glycoside hydrolase family 32 protein [Zafaria sp. J156]